MRLLIGVLVFLLITVPLLSLADEDYIPLTREEADEWLHTIPYDKLLDFVIMWDRIEHSAPIATQPDIFAILDNKNDLYLSYPDPMVVKIGFLEYEFQLNDQVIEDFVPKKGKVERTILLIGVGFLTGAIVGIIAIK